MRIRRARAGDAAALTDLVMRAKQSNGYDDRFMAACAEELRVTPARIAGDMIWLAEADGRPLGCASLSDIGPESATVALFFVAPDAQRRGVGRALWGTLRTAAQTTGLRRLTLDADPAAVPFYCALGFAVTGKVPSGSIPGRTIPQMRIALPVQDGAPA